MLFPILLSITLIAYAVYAWRSFDQALILLCALTPTYLVRFSVGPIPTTLLEGFVLVTIAVFALRFARNVPRRLKATPLTVSVALLSIAAIISTLIAPDKTSALGILKAFYLEPLLLGLIMAHRFDRSQFEKAFVAFCASGLIVSAFAVIQILFHIGIPEAWTIEGRATSIYPYPNAVGLFLAPIVSALIVKIIQGKSWTVGLHKPSRKTLLPAAFCILSLIAILLAKTEAALIAIPAAVILTMMIAPIKTQTKAIVFTGAAIIGLLAFAFVPAISNKLTLHDTSGLVRRSQWSETLTMLADHTYLGVGLNAYPGALVPYHDATLYEIFQYPHNIILNIWSELGLLGLVSFAGLFAIAMYKAWQNKKDPWVLVCFAALLTMCIHGLVDVPFFKNDLAILTVFFFVGVMHREGVGRSV